LQWLKLIPPLVSNLVPGFGFEDLVSLNTTTTWAVPLPLLLLLLLLVVLVLIVVIIGTLSTTAFPAP
jgi:hypothetical protein